MTAVYPEPYTIGHRVYSSTGDDGYGNPVESWAPAVDVACYAVYPGIPGEDYEPGRVASQIPMFVLGTATALGSIRARDRIVWASKEYEVDGEPENFNYGPFGFTPGIRVCLKRVEG